MLEKLPESTKAMDSCVYLAEDGKCYNALNYLRPRRCEAYCAVKVDGWVRWSQPELNDSLVRAFVIQAMTNTSE